VAIFFDRLPAGDDCEAATAAAIGNKGGGGGGEVSIQSTDTRANQVALASARRCPSIVKGQNALRG